VDRNIALEDGDDTDFEGSMSILKLPASHFRAAAARARRLEAEATTPRVKQHLRRVSDRYELLAGQVEKSGKGE
jgi:hypothetical protein